MTGSRVAPSLIVATLAFAACESGHGPTSASGGVSARPVPPVVPPTFVRGPMGGAPIEAFISEEVRKNQAAGVLTLVYVGAPWCEPCQRFHQAVEKGELDSLLAGTRFIEFDLDVDKESLERVGYSSTLIPLFVVPRPDGKASDVRMEGSIKGDGAVKQNLSPRLRALLERVRRTT